MAFGCWILGRCRGYGWHLFAIFPLLILIAAPILRRHRANRNVQGFVKGAYAAAIGTILGASVLLGQIAIGDWLTILIGLISLLVLFRWKVSNPLRSTLKICINSRGESAAVATLLRQEASIGTDCA